MEILLYQLEKMVHRGNQHLKRFARTERAKRVKHDGKTTRVLLLRLQLESYIIYYRVLIPFLIPFVRSSSASVRFSIPLIQGLLITYSFDCENLGHRNGDRSDALAC